MITTIGLIGYTGRMGQAIARAIENSTEACLGGGLVRGECLCPTQKNSDAFVTCDPAELYQRCDVMVDFSHASATPLYARLAAQYGKPFLSGTTGLNEETFAVLRETAQTVPVLYAANTSLSVAVVRRLVESAARLLKDQDYDVTIFDKHHKWKKDAPSGTALMLGKTVEAANEGKHAPSYASLRAGAIVGEHEVSFTGPGETITIHHAIADRRVLASGALTAALWLAGQKPGMYGMDDVLGV